MRFRLDRARLGRALLAASIAVGFAGGCAGPTQSPECAKSVACVRALDAKTGRKTNLVRFEPTGPCWGGEEAGATLCTDGCKRGLPFLVRDTPAADVPEACR